MFNNCRGVKSKLGSLQEIITGEKTIILGTVETKLCGSDKIEIEGYTINTQDRKEEGGGVLKEIWKK